MVTVAIVGIGFVGLPVACLAARKGFTTIALDIDQKKIDLLKEGKSHIKDPALSREVAEVYKDIRATSDYSSVKEADIIIVAVPTPVDKSDRPNLTILESVCRDLAPNINKEQLIIIESTIGPGTCEEIVMPLLFCPDINLAHCPERIDPGKSAWSPGWNLENIPRVLGASSEKALKKATAFYTKLLTAKIHTVSSLKAAEASKVVENSFRDLNIAFANELAQSCDALGIDAVEVINAAKTKPYAFMAHYPSSGVGGHCISTDPYYLIDRAKGAGFTHRFLTLAREINNRMPLYTVEKIAQALNEKKKSICGTTITVLGVTYKGNVDDCRESPALKIIELLQRRGANVIVYDPFIPSKSTVNSLSEALNAECIVIGAEHEEFLAITPQQFKSAGAYIIVDGKNCLNKEDFIEAGIVYRGIGR